jgi:hypothetical protein
MDGSEKRCGATRRQTAFPWRAPYRADFRVGHLLWPDLSAAYKDCAVQGYGKPDDRKPDERERAACPYIKKQPSWVHIRTYLHGLDGALPRNEKSQTEKGDATDSSETASKENRPLPPYARAHYARARAVDLFGESGLKGNWRYRYTHSTKFGSIELAIYLLSRALLLGQSLDLWFISLHRRLGVGRGGRDLAPGRRV